MLLLCCVVLCFAMVDGESAGLKSGGLEKRKAKCM